MFTNQALVMKFQWIKYPPLPPKPLIDRLLDVLFGWLEPPRPLYQVVINIEHGYECPSGYFRFFVPHIPIPVYYGWVNFDPVYNRNLAKAMPSENEIRQLAFDYWKMVHLAADTAKYYPPSLH